MDDRPTARARAILGFGSIKEIHAELDRLDRFLEKVVVMHATCDRIAKSKLWIALAELKGSPPVGTKEKV